MGCTDTVKQIKGKRTRNGVKCDSFGTWSDIYPLDNVLNLFLDKGQSGQILKEDKNEDFVSKGQNLDDCIDSQQPHNNNYR